MKNPIIKSGKFVIFRFITGLPLFIYNILSNLYEFYLSAFSII